MTWKYGHASEGNWCDLSIQNPLAPAFPPPVFKNVWNHCQFHTCSLTYQLIADSTHAHNKDACSDLVSCLDLAGVLRNVYFENSPQQVWGWLQWACCWLNDCLPVIFRKLRYSYSKLGSRIIIIHFGWLKSHDTIICFLYMQTCVG